MCRIRLRISETSVYLNYKTDFFQKKMLNLIIKYKWYLVSVNDKDNSLLFLFIKHYLFVIIFFKFWIFHFLKLFNAKKIGIRKRNYKKKEWEKNEVFLRSARVYVYDSMYGIKFKLTVFSGHNCLIKQDELFIQKRDIMVLSR